ncbi:MAG TPA: 50S ribosomal protein L28 [Candidatus Pacebacteria bacterium]|nr:50S ribosomal protein L28 [Candidatus Paceibacterota bacterium]HCR11393.1 50S ribosomal protein L28 [Candidatus Paceibacterota bacterium]HCR93076.1 50S ribosomal protein L28 [Candidatus Paceibacterota bacterium]
MNTCYTCHKTADFGHLVSHAKNRHAHMRKPNLHHAHMMVNGVKIRVLLCTTCIRIAHAKKTPTKTSAK